MSRAIRSFRRTDWSGIPCRLSRAIHSFGGRTGAESSVVWREKFTRFGGKTRAESSVVWREQFTRFGGQTRAESPVVCREQFARFGERIGAESPVVCHEQFTRLADGLERNPLSFGERNSLVLVDRLERNPLSFVTSNSLRLADGLERNPLSFGERKSLVLVDRLERNPLSFVASNSLVWRTDWSGISCRLSRENHSFGGRTGAESPVVCREQFTRLADGLERNLLSFVERKSLVWRTDWSGISCRLSRAIHSFGGRTGAESPVVCREKFTRLEDGLERNLLSFVASNSLVWRTDWSGISCRLSREIHSFGRVDKSEILNFSY